MPTFNLLISTINRPSLTNQLSSLVPQLKKEDCLTIVFDGKPIPNLPILNEFICTVDLYSEPVALGWWGHAVRNKYAELLKPRDFVLHGDDDDVYVPDSLDKLREQVTNSNTLYIAKMRHPNLGNLPRNHVIELGNIGTPCGIIPYNINKRGQWGYRYGGDCAFYKSISELVDKVEFLDTLIYIVLHV